MWIPGITINTFIKYGFNHSKESKSYLDIKKYIKVFGLNKIKILPLDIVEVECWNITSSGSKIIMDYNKLIKYIAQDDNFIIKIIEKYDNKYLYI